LRSSFLQEQPHSCSFLHKSKGQEWERLYGLFSATWVELSGLICAGEGAGGVSHRVLQVNLWGDDDRPPRSLSQGVTSTHCQLHRNEDELRTVAGWGFWFYSLGCSWWSLLQRDRAAEGSRLGSGFCLLEGFSHVQSDRVHKENIMSGVLRLPFTCSSSRCFESSGLSSTSFLAGLDIECCSAPLVPWPVWPLPLRAGTVYSSR